MSLSYTYNTLILNREVDMSKNILHAIINLVNTSTPIYKIKEFYKSNNRANNSGDALEEYVKDLFAGTIDEKDFSIRQEKISKTFSYLGNQNNPPDMIIRSGDAIEVKKIENYNSSLALNSSYPKAKLNINNPMLTKECKQCENWIEKDIIYIVGTINKNNDLKFLSFLYGVDYAANDYIYERIKLKIKEGILDIHDVEFSETKELGRINKVDPLGITYLRVRGMWHIDNPFKVFKDIYKPDKSNNFNFMTLINNEKYDTLPLEQKSILETLHQNLKIADVKIPSPDNPANLKNAKLITFYN